MNLWSRDKAFSGGSRLRFTYAFTISRSDALKMPVIEEVNALGTAFICADPLQEPHPYRVAWNPFGRQTLAGFL